MSSKCGKILQCFIKRVKLDRTFYYPYDYAHRRGAGLTGLSGN
ncbi:hypothetical protein HMPREF9096_00709 [Haemophilus sp. oral taxon 851 str. F0397]|nr:hypothetical protein HMPREF9096_00709 [Haemophilus sp. oral taxon 851 str. F0397]